MKRTKRRRQRAATLTLTRVCSLRSIGAKKQTRSIQRQSTAIIILRYDTLRALFKSAARQLEPTDLMEFFTEPILTMEVENGQNWMRIADVSKS
jgi:hypothetical protein